VPASPPALRLGRELSRLRDAAGYTGRKGAEQVAATTGISVATIYRAEKGEGLKKDRDIQALLGVYRANAERADAVMELVRQTKAPGWWAGYDIPEDFGLYLAMEQAASEIWWFEPLLTPGLLQTEGYARTIITADSQAEMTEDETASKIRFRMDRQRILDRAPDQPSLHVLIGEEVIHRPIGGPAVQAAQLDRLHQAAALPSVSVRVVPFGTGYYRGLDTGPFEVLHFPPDSDGQVYERPTVYADGGFAGTGYFESPEEVARYTAAFEAIRSRALSEADSRTLIKQSTEVLRV
jgi:transcriptional regulator with XRE-family HTH domain